MKRLCACLSVLLLFTALFCALPASAATERPDSSRYRFSNWFNSGAEGVTSNTLPTPKALAASTTQWAEVSTVACSSWLSRLACARSACSPSTKLPAVLLRRITSQ